MGNVLVYGHSEVRQRGIIFCLLVHYGNGRLFRSCRCRKGNGGGVQMKEFKGLKVPESRVSRMTLVKRMQARCDDSCCEGASCGNCLFNNLSAFIEWEKEHYPQSDKIIWDEEPPDQFTGQVKRSAMVN